jgi:hypothetical protein
MRVRIGVNSCWADEWLSQLAVGNNLRAENEQVTLMETVVKTSGMIYAETPLIIE